MFIDLLVLMAMFLGGDLRQGQCSNLEIDKHNHKYRLLNMDSNTSESLCSRFAILKLDIY